MRVAILLLFLQLFACQNPPEESSEWLEVPGRDGNPTYRIKKPKSWMSEISKNAELADTTKPLMEFIFAEGEIRITIHNFPMLEGQKRIPPAAQIARWKRQFDHVDPANVIITPQSYGGFTGYLFEAIGVLEGETITTLAWIMQLTSNYSSNLEVMQITHPQKQNHYQQMQADYTIKASGPSELLEKNHQVILRFAQSFELLEELPI